MLGETAGWVTLIVYAGTSQELPSGILIMIAITPFGHTIWFYYVLWSRFLTPPGWHALEIHRLSRLRFTLNEAVYIS